MRQPLAANVHQMIGGVLSPDGLPGSPARGTVPGQLLALQVTRRIPHSMAGFSAALRTGPDYRKSDWQIVRPVLYLGASAIPACSVRVDHFCR